MIASRGWSSAGAPRCPTVAVVGAGFSGAAVALHLASCSRSPLNIVLIDPAERVGRGLAYRVRAEHLLLNVPAARLTCRPERPGGFALWCRASGRDVADGDFLPRAWFGEYVESELAAALERAHEGVELHRVRDSVAGIAGAPGGRLDVLTRCGGLVTADHVVLATGHGPARCPAALRPCLTDARVLACPWDGRRLRELAASARRLLVVGTGLTMCDTAITLERIGFAGELIAVSRHGLLPRVHGPSKPADHAAWAASLAGRPLGELLRELRTRAAGPGWRGVIDSLRPHTAAVWRSLGAQDRERFVGRLASLWDVHRHRCPPETGAAIDLLREKGRLQVIAASITGARARRGAIETALRCAPDGSTLKLGVDGIVLCTGPAPDPREWGSPLMDALIRRGLVVAEPLGIRTDDEGFAIGADGAATGRLSTLGSLRRGALWESTAVPELGAQAARLADVLASRLGVTNEGTDTRLRYTREVSI
ncbi:MAG TPA: FAD/NAD(P)-binding protein [Phycisphaerales bacterium]|nr:FAD/NAD(P)-binding protein [Phycisphaerales bacterium]